VACLERCALLIPIKGAMGRWKRHAVRAPARYETLEVAEIAHFELERPWSGVRMGPRRPLSAGW